MLRSMQQDPEQIVAMPNSLITLQPTLRQMKDGLVAAQLRTARLSGTRTPEHPDVVAALDSERQIRQDLHRELGVAIDGLEVQLRVGRGKLERLDNQLASIEARLAVLASNRAEYSNRVAAVDSGRRVLDDARQKLSEAMAAKAAVQSASLVTKIDNPETGSNPVGARRAVVVAAGMIGGAMLGVGWIVLMVPVPGTAPVAPMQVGNSQAPIQAASSANQSNRETITEAEQAEACVEAIRDLNRELAKPQTQPPLSGTAQKIFPGMTLREAQHSVAAQTTQS